MTVRILTAAITTLIAVAYLMCALVDRDAAATMMPAGVAVMLVALGVDGATRWGRRS